MHFYLLPELYVIIVVLSVTYNLSLCHAVPMKACRTNCTVSKHLAETAEELTLK